MDLRCRFCGEPIAMDEFHNAEFGSFKAWTNKFSKHGCAAVDALFSGEKPASVKTDCREKPILDVQTIEKIDIGTDLLAGDIDGLAALIDDISNGF